jgi:hypothetical protein
MAPRKELTHLVVSFFALPSRANKRVKPWLDTIADDSMQAFIWRLVATEEIKQMELGGKWCYGVKRWSPLNQRERRTIRW